MKTVKDPRRTISPAWMIAAAGLLLSCLGWTLLSQQFQFGEGHASRPIIEFLGLFFLAWICFLLGFFLLSRRNADQKTLVLIVVVGLLLRIILMPSNPIQENDFYRYVLDGQVLLHGANPYQYAPLVISDLGAEPLKRELRRPEAVTVLSRIGYPEIPTLYPPVAQLAFAVGGWVGEWDWMGQRWTFVAVDLAVFALLIYLLSWLAIPVSWVLLYIWNPLVLKETVNSVHLDVLVAFFLLAAIGGLLKQSRAAGFQWALLSGFALGLAILSKLYPVLLIPACFFYLRRRAASRSAPWAFAVTALVVIFFGFLPFLAIGLDRLTEGLVTYGSLWTMNAGAFAVLSRIAPHPRLVSAAILVLVSLLLPWFRRSETPSSLVEDCQWILLIWFLLIPAPFPWYALPIMALLPLGPKLSAVSAASLMLSGVSACYYLSFYYEYHDYPSSWWEATRGIEHGVLWIFLTGFVVYHLILNNQYALFQNGKGMLQAKGKNE
jgi:alpha-1,6-mannosyltransferase